jgi:hypothetical protein
MALRFKVGAVVGAHHEVHSLQDTPHRYQEVFALQELCTESGVSGRGLAQRSCGFPSGCILLISADDMPGFEDPDTR